ncbi:MAG TPA: dihydrodipicolinate synthase family protein [Aestuariivirgaceae bacterium]|jgi:4-hydroxy-tetrahydrodipicolinate synthase
MKRWQGVFPAVTTKFSEDGRLDIAEIERCLAVQAQVGVNGVILAGSLGEGPMLDMLEKTEVLRAALRVSAKRFPVLMTISHSSTREACLFAEASARNGADGLAVHPAIAYKSDPIETESHFRAIAKAGGIPLMVCNNPSVHGVDITAELLARIADEPLFWAVEESSGDVRRITRIINLTGNRYDLFAGIDSLALESLLMGAKGWVAGIAGTFPKEAIAVWRYATLGHMEEARRLYRWFRTILDLETSTKAVQNVKLVESLVMGSNDRCRLPRQPLKGEERLRVERLVRYALVSRAGVALHPPAAE